MVLNLPSIGGVVKKYKKSWCILKCNYFFHHICMTSTSNAGRTNKRVFSKLKQLKSPAYKSFHTLSVSITISLIKYIRNLCLPRNGSKTAICYHEKKTATTPKHYITPARFKFSMSLLKCIFFLRYPYLFKYSFISFVIICRIERLWRHEAKTKN